MTVNAESQRWFLRRQAAPHNPLHDRERDRHRPPPGSRPVRRTQARSLHHPPAFAAAGLL